MRNIYCISFLIFLMSCSTQPEWDGRVEEVNGVRYVYNGIMPYGTPPDFKLTHLVDVETEEIFHDGLPVSVISSIALHEDGSFYAADNMNNRILHFDTGGTVLNVFGREGEGPGEFSMLTDIAADAMNRVYALDYMRRRIAVFKEDGTFLKSIPIEEMGMSLAVLDTGAIYIAPFKFMQEEGDLVTGLDSNGKKIRTYLGRVPEYKDVFSSVAMAPTEDGLYAAFPYPYRIERYDRDGVLRDVVIREHPHFQPPEPPRTHSDGGRMVISSGRLQSEIGNILVHDDGYIFVNVIKLTDNGDVGLEPRKSELDIFSSDGFYLSTIQLPDGHGLGGMLGNTLYTYVAGGHAFPSVSTWELDIR